MADKILVVDDDPSLRKMLTTVLSKHYQVEEAASGEDALKIAAQGDVRLVLLDVMMPGMSGLETCLRLRRNPRSCHATIVMLTARKQEEDVVEGLKVGADDYMTKPFEIDELVARIEAIFRRSQKGVNVDGITEFHIGKYTFNLNTRTLTFEGVPQKLTTKEAGLLEQLCIQQNGILTREIALKAVWGSDNYFTGRSMDVYITKIRKYLNRDSNIEIQNIHGEGYKLVVTQS